jgi:predicted RNA binding protein YcfA (HicA-like mRNA interferase family)
MRLKRDVSGWDLIKALSKIGYAVSKQKGSHVRLSKETENIADHITIPNHDSVKIGILSKIISDIARENGLEKEDIYDLL